mmetsp:Transcript_10201/g.28086  ORF Transcript_10201/g.28086 Transcript_10201/m.28086 type:complete len:821 (+) Transcript_10201:165-2627(+)
MLGSDRFAFETPNVIDAGDDAPAAPPRRASAVEYEQARSSSDRLLSDIQDLQLQPDANGNDEQERFLGGGPQNNYDHHPPYSSNPFSRSRRPYSDDPSASSGSSDNTSQQTPPEHSLPSVEEARTYAASILHATEQTRSGGNSSSDPFARTVQLAAPSSVPTSSSSLKSLGFRGGIGGASWGGAGGDHPKTRSTTTASSSSKHLVRREVLSFASKAIVAVLLAILFIVLVIMCVQLTKQKRGDEESASTVIPETPLTRLEKVYAFIHQTLLTDTSELVTPGRPQYMASNWIANMDILSLDVPTALNTTAAQAFVQRYVLALLYYATNGPDGWRNKASFLSEQSECGWFDRDKNVVGFNRSQTYALGVTCNSDLEVVNLLLPSNGLKGSIPQEIGFLTSLTLLSMPHNQLTDEIPADMANLVGLQYLDLKFNFLKGRIPNMFETVNDLRVLGLSNNYLEDQLPPSFDQLTALKTLAIDDNLLEGDLSVVQAMTQLEFFYADRNEFSGEVDNSFLADLTQLRELDLSGNQLTSTSFSKHLLQHPTLRILDFSGNSIQGQIPAQLDENNVLEFLSLRNNKLSGSVDPTSLPMLYRLDHLDVSGNLLEGHFPGEMTQIQNLTFLFMGNNPMLTPGPIPSWLYELKHLRELSLTNMKRTNDVPFWFDDLEDMLFLDLSHNELSGHVPRQVWDLPKLAYILLHNNTLSGQVPVGIVGGNKLQMVTLFDNGFSGDLDHVCAEAPVLELLAADCQGMTCSEECCPSCCDRGASAGVNAFCFNEAVPTYLTFFEGLWELNYTRAQHSFDPALVTDDPENPVQPTEPSSP